MNKTVVTAAAAAIAVPYHGSALAVPQGHSAQVAAKKTVHPGMLWSSLLSRKPLIVATFSEKVARDYNSHVAGRAPLLTGDALVDQNLNLDATVLGSSGASLVRCHRIRFTHRARGDNVLYRNTAVLEQIGDH
jgi:hypothetical protein